MVEPLWKIVLQFLTKLNILLLFDPGTTLLGIYPQNTENSCPHKSVYADVYGSFIHNCLNLEAAKMSFSR